MRKIFTSLLVISLMIISEIQVVNALTPQESYEALQSYYQSKKTLLSADEVIAYEALGNESDNLKVEQLVSTDYASEIAKTVIALTLHGDDPKDYEGKNYVEMLENCVQSTGAIDLKKEATDANFQFIGVNALYVVGSDKTKQAADYLASLINEIGAFCFAGGYEDLGVTSWVVETLTLVDKDKYEETIQKAIHYIQSKQNEKAAYDGYGYGADANTQACVLMGLLTYDQEGVKNKTYNKGDNHPYDVLLTFQNEDGSFFYQEKTKGADELATIQGTQAVGYYHNGSVYIKAKKDYQELSNSMNYTYIVVGIGILIVSGLFILKGRKKVEN